MRPASHRAHRHHRHSQQASGAQGCQRGGTAFAMAARAQYATAAGIRRGAPHTLGGNGMRTRGVTSAGAASDCSWQNVAS